jgi:hypothetical protein
VKTISELIDEFEASRNVGRDLRVGPSDYGKCPRQVQLRVQGVEPGETREKTRAATMGTLFWLGLGNYIAAKYPDAIVEQAVAVPGLERDGNVDLRWQLDGVIVDVKTVSSRAYEHVVTFGAKPENVGQLETYALAVNRHCERVGDELVHTLQLHYVNRDNGDVHPIEWAYDEKVARTKLSELVHMEQMIELGEELPRAENARLGAFPCDWCPFWRHCWDVPEGDAPDDYAAKFTDSDEKIEAAIETYLQLGVVERETKAARAAARDQLVGIEYAAGGYKLSWGGGRTTYVDEVDYDALVVQAQLAGIEVPMKTTEVRPVRRINVRRSAS